MLTAGSWSRILKEKLVGRDGVPVIDAAVENDQLLVLRTRCHWDQQAARYERASESITGRILGVVTHSGGN